MESVLLTNLYALAYMIVPAALFLIALYFVVKNGVYSGLKKHGEERREKDPPGER